MSIDIEWERSKNEDLKRRYGFGFERVIVALSEAKLLDDRAHPNIERHGHQRQLVVEIDGYAWIVPLVSDGEKAFFKTLFPSRKATKRYLGD